MKYIPADKLIAEIEKRIIEHKKILKEDNTLISAAMLKGSLGAYESIESFITSLQRERPEVDLDALVNEAFDKYGSVDRYCQLSVSFNRAELYSFIKKLERKEE